MVGVERDPAHLEHGRALFPWVQIMPATQRRSRWPTRASTPSCFSTCSSTSSTRSARSPKPTRPASRRRDMISVPHRRGCWSVWTRSTSTARSVDAVRRGRRWKRPRSRRRDAPSLLGCAADRLLEPEFAVDRVARTGLGLQELLYLARCSSGCRCEPNRCGDPCFRCICSCMPSTTASRSAGSPITSQSVLGPGSGGRRMSPRVLFACWPFEGHVFPQISIARALRDRGDTVAFYTGAGAGATIRSEGFELFGFEQVGPEWLRVQEREQSIGGRRQSKRVQRQAFQDWLVKTIPGQVEDLRRIIADWQPDVVITDLAMWSTTYILFEALPIPVALSSTFMGPLMPGPDAPPQGLGLPAPKNAVTKACPTAAVKVTELIGLPLRRRGRPAAGRQRARADGLLGGALHAASCRSTSSPTCASSTGTARTCRRACTTSARDLPPAREARHRRVAGRRSPPTPVGARHRGHLPLPGSLRAPGGGAGPRLVRLRGDHDHRRPARPRGARAHAAARQRPRDPVVEPHRAAATLPGRRHHRRPGHDHGGAAGGRPARHRAHHVGQARQRPPRRGCRCGRQSRHGTAPPTACGRPSSACSQTGPTEMPPNRWPTASPQRRGPPALRS